MLHMSLTSIAQPKHGPERPYAMVVEYDQTLRKHRTTMVTPVHTWVIYERILDGVSRMQRIWDITQPEHFTYFRSMVGANAIPSTPERK